MPYFYFDLVVGEEFKDQGGMILEDTQIAFEKADSLASELYIVRPAIYYRLHILFEGDWFLVGSSPIQHFRLQTRSIAAIACDHTVVAWKSARKRATSPRWVPTPWL